MTRPDDSRCRVATCLASTNGSRSGATSTDVPRRSRSVTAARCAIVTSASYTPPNWPPNSPGGSTWSGSHAVAYPGLQPHAPTRQAHPQASTATRRAIPSQVPRQEPHALVPVIGRAPFHGAGYRAPRARYRSNYALRPAAVPNINTVEAISLPPWSSGPSKSKAFVRLGGAPKHSGPTASPRATKPPRATPPQQALRHNNLAGPPTGRRYKPSVLRDRSRAVSGPSTGHSGYGPSDQRKRHPGRCLRGQTFTTGPAPACTVGLQRGL
jgi:hypothetical protein